jgi:hypothetical protein
VRTLVDSPAFDFGELRFDWGDVVLAAIGWQEWQRLERSLAEDLAWVSDAQTRCELPDPDALRDATLAFRRAHNLLAGEDYKQWLLDRALSTREVDAHLTRVLLRDRAGDRAGELAVRNPTDPRELAGAMRGEAVLSGRLRSWAQRLARCAAAQRGLAAAPEPLPNVSPAAAAALLTAVSDCPAAGLSLARAGERAPRVSGLLAAELEFRARVATRERLERSLAEHRLDWQRLLWTQADFASEGAAREAALAVRADGRTLDEIAGLARASTSLRDAYCADVPELSAMLVGAVPGELLGPFAADGGWRLACVRERIPPTVEDPVLHTRASAEAVEDALGRHLGGGVVWHGER